MKTAIITTDTFLNHDTGLGHPERADRVSVILENLKKFEKKLVWKKPITVDKKFLKITHSSKYVDMIESSFPEKGFSYLDGDTVVSPGSKEATFDAVGSIIAAIQKATDSKVENLGKPSRKIFKIASDYLGFRKSDILVIGDNLNTDIYGSSQAGLDSALVLTGKTELKDVRKSKLPFRPSYTIKNLRSL